MTRTTPPRRPRSKLEHPNRRGGHPAAGRGGTRGTTRLGCAARDPPRTEVRAGPTVVDDPPLEPIEFEAADTAEIDTVSIQPGTARGRDLHRAMRGAVRTSPPTGPPSSAFSCRSSRSCRRRPTWSQSPSPKSPCTRRSHDSRPTRRFGAVPVRRGADRRHVPRLTTAPGTDTGWDMNDGIATVVAGVLGFAAAGRSSWASATSFRRHRHRQRLRRHRRPRPARSEALSTRPRRDRGRRRILVVLGGAVAMLLAGVADQSRFGD